MRRLPAFLPMVPLLMTTAMPAVAQSPTTTEELLSGMVTKEVEPGVFRIIDDGVRDLTHQGGGPYWRPYVLVDGTGGVWRSVPPDRYFRLGAQEEWALSGLQTFDDRVAFSDGRLVTARSTLADLARHQSAMPEALDLHGDQWVIEAQADGTVWILRGGDVLVRVPRDDIPEVIDWADVHAGQADGFTVTPDGVAWLWSRPRTSDGSAPAFLNYADGDWEVVPVPEEVSSGFPYSFGLYWEMFDVGIDGTLWMVGDEDSPHRTLARYDGQAWTIFGESDGIRPWGSQRVGVWNSPFPAVRVAPDGSAWVNASGPGEWGCGGLARFDGVSWAAYLPGTCISDYEVAPEGAVWVVGSGPGDVYEDEHGVRAVDLQTYVITPEAVAGTE